MAGFRKINLGDHRVRVNETVDASIKIIILQRKTLPSQPRAAICPWLHQTYRLRRPVYTQSSAPNQGSIPQQGSQR